MKIAFLCGSLEPGQDGVGDYTRKLAAELIRQGHDCRLLAINDRGIQNEARDIGSIETQQDGGTPIQCLRLPRAVVWKERVASARRWMEEWRPDWLSLQFVCYGFHPKGLSSELPESVNSIAGPARRHLMFHELWVFPWLRTTFANRVIGQGQRWLIRRLHRRFAPEFCSTQNAFYRGKLKRIGIEARHLPLFGNIARSNDARAQREFQTKIFGEGHETQSTKVLMGFFGTIHEEPALEPLLRKLARAGLAADKRLVVCSAGRLGSAGEAVWNGLQKTLAAEVEFRRFGHLSEIEVSYYLQSLHFALSSYSPEFIEKSGAAAACLEHGLTVLLARSSYRNDTPAECDTVAAVDAGWQLTSMTAAALMADHGGRRQPLIDGVTATATNLCQQWQEAS